MKATRGEYVERRKWLMSRFNGASYLRDKDKNILKPETFRYQENRMRRLESQEQSQKEILGFWRLLEAVNNKDTESTKN